MPVPDLAFAVFVAGSHHGVALARSPEAEEDRTTAAVVRIVDASKSCAKQEDLQRRSK